MRRQQASPPPFQSYLDDLNSSTSCCRSASLLVPASYANDILQTLRCKGWICQAVLTRPWRKKATCIDRNNDLNGCTGHQDDSWYYQCLPSEEELAFLNQRHGLSYLSSPSCTSLQTQIVKYNMQCKSLLVPLTDDATEFLLRAWFEEVSIPDDREGYNLVCNWLRVNGIMIVHNYDENQTVSLFKEIDCFPKSDAKLEHVREGQSNHSFTFVDLFAGIGGFRIGMESLGGKCIGSSEIDAYARETYYTNFLRDNKESGEEFFVNDIARLEILPCTVDVICGGFPCQSFTTMASFPSSSDESGSGSNRRQGGLLTPAKGKLFFHLLRILRKARPRMFVFENVKGLMSLDNGSHFERILHLLEESGYHVSHGVVDAAWFLPQRRERVYFVGIRHDLFDGDNGVREYVAFTSNELKEKYQIYDNELDMSVDKYERLLDILALNNSKGAVAQSSRTLQKSEIGDILDADDKIPAHCFLTKHQWEKVQSQTYLQLHRDGSGQLITKESNVAQTLVSSYRQSYLLHSQFIVPCSSSYLTRQEETLQSVALAKTDVDGVTDCNIEATDSEEQLPRFFTPRECCRLQGFPETFEIPSSDSIKSNKQHRQRISQFYRQVGNAVSPPCVAAVAKTSVDMLFSSSTSSFASSCHIDDLDCPVRNLLLRSCLRPEKVISSINRKKSIRLDQPV